MNKFAKIILIIFAFVIFGLLLHFNVFENLFTKLPFVKNFYDNSVLTINTRRGNARVTLNGVEYGETPQSISNLSEGEYLVELDKITESGDIYQKQTFYIELYNNTEAIIDIEIAPENFKSGHILYYSPLSKTFEKNGALTLRSDVNDYEVLINNQEIPKEDIVSYQLSPAEYDVQVTSQGYESLEFPIIIREGYNLNVRVYLLPIPIEF